MSFDRLDFVPSAGLLREIGGLEPREDLRFDHVDSARSVEEYCASLMGTVYGLEIIERLMGLGTSLRILDIGFGMGESSLFLANGGNEVASLDPSPNHCANLAHAARRFDLPIRVIQGPAEAIDQIEDAGFDVCIFNSSLHHCDQPLQALANCRGKLVTGGRVLAINEPILKPYVTKARAYRRFEEAPEETGNYGGNEHVYYFHEYIDLMKRAGFGRVCYHVHVRHRHPRDTVLFDVQKHDEGVRTASDTKLLAKFALMVGLERLQDIDVAGPVAMRLLARMSLIPASFEAMAPSSASRKF